MLAAIPAAASLLRDGSFEHGPEWRARAGRGVVFHQEVSPGRASPRSVQLRVDAYERVDRTSRASLEQPALTGLAGGHWYRLTGWLRAEGLRSGLVRAILVDDHGGENGGLYLELVAAGGWRRFEKTFRATLTAGARPRLEFFIEETGAVWFDDLELAEVPEPHPVFTDTVPAGDSVNLIPNASFEGGTAGWSSLGRRTGWVAGLSSLHGDLDPGTAADGGHSLRIALDRTRLSHSHFDIWPAARVAQDAPLAANLGWIPVPRGADVTLSAWLRADRPGVPAVLSLHFGEPEQGPGRQERRVTLTTEWTRYSFTCPAATAHAFVAVGPDLGGTTFDSAVVWLDALQLEAGPQATAFVARENLAVHAATARFGNVFTGGDRPVIRLAVENRGSARRLDLHVRIRDYFDRALPAQTLRLALDENGRQFHDFQPALPGRGHYTVTVHASPEPAAPDLLLRPLTLAWVEDNPESDSPFGLNHVPGTAELSAQLRRAGVTWGRDWSVNWQQLEPAPGALDFTAADIQIDRIRREGLNPLVLLPPFPSAHWASSIPAGALAQAPGWSKLWIEAAYAPRDPALLEEFIRKAAAHFRHRVSTWEFLNEPFYTLHALPALDQIDEEIKGLDGASYHIGDYVDLLARAYRATKAANPESRLVGGLSGRPDLMSRDFIAAGGLAHLDIFNLHIYPGLRRPEYYIGEMERLLALMDASPSGRKPIWLTEYGYYGLDRTAWQPFVLNAWDWAGNRLLRDEREAADFSLRFAVIFLAHGVEKIFYHSGMGMSSEVNSTAEDESPLTRTGGVPRKLFAAQAALTHLLGPRPRFVAPAAFAPGSAGLHGYVFENGHEPVAVLWSAGDPVEVVLAPGVTARDVVGNPVAGRTVTLGPSPCYLTAPGLGARALAQGWQQR